MTTEVAQTVQWWIGDALNFGEQRYGEMYTQAIDETGLDYQTLPNWKGANWHQLGGVAVRIVPT